MFSETKKRISQNMAKPGQGSARLKPAFLRLPQPCYVQGGAIRGSLSHKDLR
jgi:hypothetical protein